MFYYFNHSSDRPILRLVPGVLDRIIKFVHFSVDINHRRFNIRMIRYLLNISEIICVVREIF